MLSHFWEVRPQESPPSIPQPEGWRRLGLRSTEEMEAFVAGLAEELGEAGFAADEVFTVRLALEEAIMNAIVHGHGGDSTLEVRVRYHLTHLCLLAEVEDQGPGFRLDDIADPLDPENLQRESGRGLFLMYSYMTWVRYNDKGNCVTLCKRRDAA